MDVTDTIDEFCRAQYARLFGMLRLYCGDVWLAEELVQESLARVVRHWQRVETMDNPSAWLHRVAFNLANSSYRRRAAERRVARQVRPVVAYENPDSPAVLAVREAVAALPLRQREVVVLRYFLDLSVRDTAHRMGCAEGTVKSLLADAVRSLRARGLEVETE